MRYLSTNQLSDLTGKDRRTIKSRLASLEVHAEKGRAQLYDAHKALELIYTHDTATGLEKKLLAEQLRYETARANKVEIEVAKRRGELVEIDLVSETVGKEYGAVRSALIAIPNRVCHAIAPLTEPKEIETLLSNEINEVLEALRADADGQLKDAGQDDEIIDATDGPSEAAPGNTDTEAEDHVS